MWIAATLSFSFHFCMRLLMHLAGFMSVCQLHFKWMRAHLNELLYTMAITMCQNVFFRSVLPGVWRRPWALDPPAVGQSHPHPVLNLLGHAQPLVAGAEPLAFILRRLVMYTLSLYPELQFILFTLHTAVVMLVWGGEGCHTLSHPSDDDTLSNI